MAYSTVSFSKSFLYTTSIIFLVWLLTSPLYAQSVPLLTTTSRPALSNPTSLLKPTPFTECFAQAMPLGVELTLTRSTSTAYQPGDSIPVLVWIKNNLPRSINDGVLFVRISRTEGNAKISVFETIIGDTIMLKRGEEKEIPLSLVLPKISTFVKGDYKAELYLLDANGRVALLSAPLFDSIANFTFTVSGPQYGLYIEPDAVRINGVAPNILSESLTSGVPITFSHTIINNTNQSRSVVVSFNVFYEDDFVKGKALYQKTDTVPISSKEKKSVTHTVPFLPAGAYLMKTTILENGRGVAVENTRFTIGDAAPRLRFSGTVTDGEGLDTNLIACLRTEATSTATIVMSLINKKGAVLMASSTQAAALRLPLSKKYENQDLFLVTEVKNNNGQVTDRWEQAISCKNDTGCGSISVIKIVYFVIAIGLIFLLFVGVRYYLKRKYV